jgi:hypothetical protein
MGTKTNALVFGGGTPTTTGATEVWNGSTWTEVNDMNTARAYHASGGLYTEGLTFGGMTPGETRVANTEIWNGTSWSETTDISTARASFGGAGDDSSGLAFSGETQTTPTGATEEWTAPITNTVTFTVS